MNMPALFCFLATGPVLAYQRAGVMQSAKNSTWFLGYILDMYEVFSEAFLGVSFSPLILILTLHHFNRTPLESCYNFMGYTVYI